jgi:hypothetical protein
MKMDSEKPLTLLNPDMGNLIMAPAPAGQYRARAERLEKAYGDLYQKYLAKGARQSIAIADEATQRSRQTALLQRAAEALVEAMDVAIADDDRVYGMLPMDDSQMSPEFKAKVDRWRALLAELRVVGQLRVDPAIHSVLERVVQMTDQEAAELEIVDMLPNYFDSSKGEDIPPELIGATILRIGTPAKQGAVSGGGLVIDFLPSGRPQALRIVLGLNELGSWIEHMTILNSSSPVCAEGLLAARQG